jgi:hypothetical protein
MDQLKKKLINTSVQGSSIVETVTALLIIVISFGAGMSIYLNVITNEQTISKTKANIILESIMAETMEQKRFLDETIQFNGLIIEKVILPFSGIENHRICSITAYHQNGQLIHLIKRVIPVIE